MLKGQINNKFDNEEFAKNPSQHQTPGPSPQGAFDPVTLPIIQFRDEIGSLPFIFATLVIMITSYLVILATPLRAQLGNSFGCFIGAVGISAVILWLLGWLIILKEKQGLSGQGILIQTIGICVCAAFIVFLARAAGGLGVLVGLLILVVAGFIIKGMSVDIGNERAHSIPDKNSDDAPGRLLIRNILNQINNTDEDPTTDTFKRIFLSKKQLAEEMKASVDIQKQKVRHAYYTSEQVKLAAISLGYMLEMELIFPAVYKELFGVDFQDIGDTSFEGLYDEFGRMRNQEREDHEEG